jgi:hypothetical protein
MQHHQQQTQDLLHPESPAETIKELNCLWTAELDTGRPAQSGFYKNTFT